MSISGEPTLLKLVTVGDFDPQSDKEIEYDFIGRVIGGRFTVREHIGGGGMADVFLASDEQLGVDVAIKLLKPRMASDELRARMVQEAQAAAQVRHSNVVRVFGTGKLDGTAYIAMELLAGPNLEQYVREYRDQRIPWKEALDLLLPALEGLHAIHERGYVHRDIKPGNILVTREPGCPPQAIVIDLGLVKPDRALRNAASPPTTEAGRMLCTPGYTSPEQAAGNPVDRRSDVYSMAITLYRVLAGRLPFADARGQPVLAVLAKHIFSEPTLLAKAAAGTHIPPAIATVIESALRKNPNDRPRTMLAFAEALRAAALESPAVSPSVLHRRPHGFLLVLSLLVALAWALLPAAPASPAVVTIDAEQVATPAPNVRIIPEQQTLAVSESMVSPPLLVPAPPPHESESTHQTTAADRVDPTVAARRVLARHKSEVQRCADLHASVERLAVVINIDARGRLSAHAKDAEDTTLSRCLDEAFRRTPLAATSRSLSFVQVFKLRATPRRP